MKFSTIIKSEDAYEIFSGATFPWHHVYDRDFISNAGVDHRSPELSTSVSLRSGGRVRLSNELLLSPDVLRRRASITITKAAVRIGYSHILVPEADAAKYETVRPAHHAVWVPDPPSGSSSWASNEYVELDALDNEELRSRILMPGLAILTEGDTLGVRVMQRQVKDPFAWRNVGASMQTLESFGVNFDGTNIKLDGVNIKLMSQECLV